MYFKGSKCSQEKLVKVCYSRPKNATGKQVELSLIALQKGAGVEKSGVLKGSEADMHK